MSYKSQDTPHLRIWQYSLHPRIVSLLARNSASKTCANESLCSQHGMPPVWHRLCHLWRTRHAKSSSPRRKHMCTRARQSCQFEPVPMPARILSASNVSPCSNRADSPLPPSSPLECYRPTNHITILSLRNTFGT
ncbi:uncharacterized protein PHACADRAFT_250153 [Phanerochaete carnosa HHB-10118-sp]|uniref:Uncharacterized protein n=1 Tax=Phanerochaete carnosa (strain HHB-10118-sp) TaxID=650164 RepID=K5X9I7_PHACS|nr:uncharacterized protein PHACADRAFT_250153 [Phanerochaete carnosa HHB-10118-sp]EKM59562.1 hypothetical protein PHACADRAFT_250153 [Phanerochaete carnosa HHB-10118-sp]